MKEEIHSPLMKEQHYQILLDALIDCHYYTLLDGKFPDNERSADFQDALMLQVSRSFESMNNSYLELLHEAGTLKLRDGWQGWERMAVFFKCRHPRVYHTLSADFYCGQNNNKQSFYKMG